MPPQAGESVKPMFTNKCHPPVSVDGVRTMELALVSIVMVIAGLISRERGLKLATQSHPSSVTREDGLRAAGFGLLVAIVAAPWPVIGLLTTYVA